MRELVQKRQIDLNLTENRENQLVCVPNPMGQGHLCHPNLEHFLDPKKSNSLMSFRDSLLENNDKCNFNWSLWGASHIGQANLVDCNQIQLRVVIAVF